MRRPTLASSVLVTFAAVAAAIKPLASPGKLNSDEFQVLAAGVLAMAFGQALRPGAAHPGDAG
jgi:hypothetical protein